MGREMVKYICVFKTGADFSPENVTSLKRAVEKNSSLGRIEFFCLTNHEGLLKEEWTVRLENGYNGAWCLPEIFKTKGPAIFTGLDTIILGSIDPLIDLAERSKDEVYMIRKFGQRPYKRPFANGAMVWNRDLSFLWDNYNYPKVKEKFPLEQDYVANSLLNSGVEVRFLQNYIGGLYSYKQHCKRRLPRDARMVMFHGTPRPWDLKGVAWINEAVFNEWRENYEHKTYQDHLAIHRWLLDQYPDQNHSGPLAGMIVKDLEGQTKSTRVLELGGWNGQLAKDVLKDISSIEEWDNYEICPDIEEVTVCEDQRYHVEVLPDFIWDLTLDLTKYDIFIASHVIEHMSFAQFKRLMDEIHHIPVLFFNIPFPTKYGSWKNSSSLHVLEANEDEITNYIFTKGYKLTRRAKTPEDSVILRFDK
jgi:hypothetical protein